MPAKQILEIKTVSDGICIDTNIYVYMYVYLIPYCEMQIRINHGENILPSAKLKHMFIRY